MNASTRRHADTLTALLQERHSCRGFHPAPLARETIQRVIEMAQRAASWCNAQPWQVHVLSAEATQAARTALLEHIGRHAPRPDLPFPDAYVGVYRDRRRECGLQLYRAVGVAREDRSGAERQSMENFGFFGAPHVALVTADRALGTYAAVDCGAFVSLFMLAAQSLGVATIAQAALAAHAGFWRSHLGLAENRVVVCGISLGREDALHPANGFRTGRAPVEEAVTWVGWA